MIHKPITNRHPDAFAAFNKVGSKARLLPITHLGATGFKVEGDRFIPQRWLFNNYVLSPNITNQGVLFRGEAIDYDEDGNVPLKCSRNYQINNQPLERIYNHIRWYDLCRLLDTNPMYRMLRRGVRDGNREDSVFKVSSKSFLHSYGISSPYVSLTSDLRIALFYAVTDYDEKLRKFVPTRKRYGILSYYELQFPITPTSRVIPVGLQVFDRPGLNKEFVCRLKGDEDYYNLPYVEGYVFEQNIKISYALLDEFKNGSLLLPSDDILADKICLSEGVFSSSAYKYVERYYPQYQLGIEHVKDKYMMIDSLEDYKHYFGFNKEELEMYYQNVDYWWYEFCNKINFDSARELDEGFLLSLPYDSKYSIFFKQCQL